METAKANLKQSILVNLSGRDDKDIGFIVNKFGLPEGKK